MEKVRRKDANSSESTAVSAWERRWALRKQNDEAEAEHFEPLPRSDASGARAPTEKIEVIARHALLGVEWCVVLPKHAKFKHVKRALAKCLGSREFLTRGQVIQKVEGVYKPYKDEDPIGEVRHVLVVWPDLKAFTEGESKVSLSDVDLSEQETSTADLCPGLVGEASSSRTARSAATSSGEQRARPHGVAKAAKSSGESYAGLNLRPDSGKKPKVKAVQKGRSLSKQQALALQMELLDGFKAPDFQAELHALARQQHTSHAEFLQARQDLFLKVQSRVLPEHGFEGSRVGVVQMMAALGPLVHDKELMRLGDEIHKLLGVDLPPEHFRAVSKQCGDLKTEALSDAKGAKSLDHQRHNQAEILKDERPGLGEVPSLPRRDLRRGKKSLPAQVPIPQSWLAPRGGRSSSAAVSHNIRPFLEALPFERWASPIPPRAMSIAGTWNDYQPEPMHWMAGLFMHPVKVGPTGRESFQLLFDGKLSSSVYPSAPDANHYDDYTICGPDAGGTGKSWQIGKGFPDAEDSSCPDKRFAVVAALDARAVVRLVGWQEF